MREKVGNRQPGGGKIWINSKRAERLTTGEK